MTTLATPVAPTERVAEMDIIRGFALLGIFIMNMPAFAMSPFAGADGSHLFPLLHDRIAEEARDVLFSGKFNSMFSFLFAVGFTIQLARLQAADPASARGIYLRRILILLALGLTHAFVFWFGDVLHIYAVLGLLLLLGLPRLSDRTLVALMVACLVIPTLGSIVLKFTLTPDYFRHQIAAMQAFEAADNLAFGHGSFADARRETTRITMFFYTDPMALWSYLKFYLEMSTTLLLGLLAGRHLWIQRAAQHLGWIRRAQWVALAVGLLAGLVVLAANLNYDPTRITALGIAGGLCYRICRLGLMIFYVTSIVRAAQLPAWRRRFAPIALAGRMPLTNYLLQTAMATFIFDAWGLGWWNRVGPLGQLLLAIALYGLIQLPLSSWWFARFRYGPLEYLWRAATYGRLPPMRAALPDTVAA